MNRKTLIAAFAGALLTFSLLGCGATNHLQSVQISTSNSAETAPGTLDLQGEGGTQQIYLWGNYTNGKSKLLDVDGGAVTYAIVVTPGSVDGDSGEPLANPPETVSLSATGLLTAVQPFACSWANSAVPPATEPAWGLSGSYTVTGSYQGLTSPPVYVGVASEAGITNTTNPTGECGPQPSN